MKLPLILTPLVIGVIAQPSPEYSSIWTVANLSAGAQPHGSSSL